MKKTKLIVALTLYQHMIACGKMCNLTQSLIKIWPLVEVVLEALNSKQEV